jgi:hypothetical protein
MSAVFSWQDYDQVAPGCLAICCPRCESGLTLHQPDADVPDRLLATCDECKSWFLANSDATVLSQVYPIPSGRGRKP